MIPETPILRRTVKLSAAINGGYFVGFGGALAAPNEPALGPLYMDTAVNDNGTVTLLGVTPAVAGGAIEEGARVAVGAGGKAVQYDPASDTVIHTAVVAGAAVGDVAVAGILHTDELVAVVQLDITNAKGLADAAMLTDEFTISEDGKINNAGGTASAGDKLLVTWARRTYVVGRALSAAAADGDEIELLVFPN